MATQRNKFTLTKAKLVDFVSESLGLSKSETEELVLAFFGEITQALTQGERVKLSGFGNFTLLDKRERPGRNPKTGEVVPVTARRVVTFKAGNKLMKRMEQLSDASSETTDGTDTDGSSNAGGDNS